MKPQKKYFECVFAILLLSFMPAFSQKALTLDECRTMALEQNKKIRIAQEEAQVAALQKKTANANYFPKISLNGGYLHTNNAMKPLENDLFLPIIPFNAIDAQTGTFNPTALQDPATAMKTLVINPQTGTPMTDASGNPIFKNYAMLPANKLVLDNQNKYFARFTVNQPLFTGFKITETNNIAKHAKNIANENVILCKAKILNKTDEAYWRAVSLQEKVKLANAYKRLLDQLVIDLKNIYAEGIITRNDVLKAQVKQNEAKLKVLKAENGFELSKMALAQIIGITSEYIKIPKQAINETMIPSSTAMAANVSVDNRAEIMMLKEKLAIMKSSKNIERSNFMPNILLTGGYGWMNPNPYNGFKKEFGGDWSIGVVISVPVFTWGERKSKLNAAKIKQRRAQIELDDAREMIDLQIRQNQFKHAESLKKVEMTKLSKEQAEENMRIAKENMLEGITRLSELLEAQVQWENASSEHIDALIEVKTTLSELEKSTGEIYRYVK